MTDDLYYYISLIFYSSLPHVLGKHPYALADMYAYLTNWQDNTPGFYYGSFGAPSNTVTAEMYARM